MANPPQLRVTGLPGLSHQQAQETFSPARGSEMRQFLQSRLQKNRAPALVHSWDFYHDRQDRQDRPANPTATSISTTSSSTCTPPPEPSTGTSTTYAQRLEHLASISDVKQFWSVHNNFPLASLSLRDTIHLFHKGTQPLWEDPRNARGGSWTFRVPKAHAESFWQQICLLAIGESLQECVEDADKSVFRDDICGVSLGVRFNSVLVQVWNRDGGNEDGRQKILACVLQNVGEEMRPKEGSYYYKRHSEHAAFGGAKD